MTLRKIDYGSQVIKLQFCFQCKKKYFKKKKPISRHFTELVTTFLPLGYISYNMFVQECTNFALAVYFLLVIFTTTLL